MILMSCPWPIGYKNKLKYIFSRSRRNNKFAKLVILLVFTVQAEWAGAQVSTRADQPVTRKRRAPIVEDVLCRMTILR